jgi:hypothetical protein
MYGFMCSVVDSLPPISHALRPFISRPDQQQVRITVCVSSMMNNSLSEAGNGWCRRSVGYGRD